MGTFNDFTGQYSLSKTLRMRLLPVGRTLEHIVNSHILDDDTQLAESYVQVKKIIDEYHKDFIERVLSDFSLQTEDIGKHNSLAEYLNCYNIKKKDESEKKEFKSIQTALRKQIADRLKKDDAFKRLDKKELIKEDLLSFLGDEPENQYKVSLVKDFSDFTTYFTGFHENRKNMYSDEEKSTAIAYRLIHENLPKFIDNMKAFELLMQADISKKMSQLYADFESYLNVENIQEMFTLDYFNVVMTQKQIEVYNMIIGGKSLEDNTKIKGINEYVNLYNQQHKGEKLPKLKLLFKQILSDRDVISWLPEKFDSDNETLSAIKGCYEQLSLYILGDRSLKNLLETLAGYDLSGVFVRNDLQLTDISQHLFGNWSVIPNAIKKQLESVLPQKKKEDHEAYQARVDKIFKSADSFSLQYIDDCLKDSGTDVKVETYWEQLGAVNTEKEQKENLFARISNAYEDVKELLSVAYPDGKNLCQDKINVEKLKTLLDVIKELQHFIKPLSGKGNEPDKDERFYGEYTALWNELDQITILYNKVRNYVTRKPYSEEKIKLNFHNSTLLNGWDLNKERDNSAVILRKGGNYYLAIMDKKYNKVFTNYPTSSECGCYEKMEYKLLPGANKMLPKVFFSKSRIDDFNPSQELLDNYEKGTHKKGDNFSLKDCHVLIDFFKSSIAKHEDWKNFGFEFSNTSSYEDLSGFYREVEQQGYKISFKNIAADYVDSLVDKGQLYLFQIYNKDFSSYSKGTPNLHTLYWKMLFDEQNLKDVVYKLNGQAEVFFRKSSIKQEHPTHPANLPVKNKNVDNPKKESLFSYDLIKDKRYTVDTFLFHVPITMNFKSQGTDNINVKVNEYLRDNEDAHVIGIDRGERHLLYLVVIDKHGNIKEQFTLNEIINEYQGVTYKTDYHNLLDKREEERQKARQSWQSIESIKELKEGYLSQVIHKIVQLMIKYHAIVVLEDLNFGFMRGRQKVEKQVYQKFEKMLIDKLNYLVDKKQLPAECGGLLKAYQLTNKFESFQKLGKQSGFLFYVPAWNTSKIDPVTGFVNLLDTRYESPEKTKSFLCKFDKIRYNDKKDWFEFVLDYNSFGEKAAGTQTKWTLCTYGTRIETFRNPEKNSQWDSKEIVLTDAFKKLFEKYQVDICGNLKETICLQESKEFFEGLMHLLRLTLQMRNSMTGTEIDYLISPVADANGHFYDSRNGNASLPANADANGAYNIARKGLWVIQQMKDSKDLGKVKLAISNKEWLQFAQEKPYLDD